MHSARGERKSAPAAGVHRRTSVVTGSIKSAARQMSGSCCTWRRPRPPRPAPQLPPRPPQRRAPRRGARARARLPRPCPAARARRRAAPSAAAWCRTCCGRPAQHACGQAVTVAAQGKGVVLDPLRLSCRLLILQALRGVHAPRQGDSRSAQTFMHSQHIPVMHCAPACVSSCGAGCCAQRSNHDAQPNGCRDADEDISTCNPI